MSPRVVYEYTSKRRFPRVSGDEPMGADYGDNPSVFSPRERG